MDPVARNCHLSSQHSPSSCSIWLGVLLLLVTSVCAAADEPALAPNRHYDGASLDVAEPLVIGWRSRLPQPSKPPSASAYEASIAPARWKESLSRMHGQPTVIEYASSDSKFRAVRLDGKSAIWQTAISWGVHAQDFTLVVTLNPYQQDSSGFVFDGSSAAGLIRLYLRDGKWHVGLQKADSRANDFPGVPTHTFIAEQWQTHVVRLARRGDVARLTHGISTEKSWSQSSQTIEHAASLAGLILGTDVATKNGLPVDIAQLQFFERALSDKECEQVAAASLQITRASKLIPAESTSRNDAAVVPQGVIRPMLRSSQEDGVHTYRIPGLAYTPKGTLLAVFDIRYDSSADLPGNIDVGLVRSTDQGKTWSKMQTIVDFDKSVPQSRGNGVGDPTILVDREKNVLWVAALWSQGDRAWHGSGPGLAPEETGQFVLVRSDDEGVTWSKPINITAQVKNPKWRLCFQGPGAGIQTSDGTLIIPAQFRDELGAPHSTFIYSRDHGDHWQIAPAAVPTEYPTSEAQIAERSDGSLLLSMRDESRSGWRSWNVWEWSKTAEKPGLPEGKWSKAWTSVPDPVCMASLISLGGKRMVMASPGSSSHRMGLTLRLSSDDGQTFSSGYMLDPRGCMYSSMVLLPNDRIGIVYEVRQGLEFATVPLSQLSPE
ncbi:Exo-alpha-sialidase [Pirellula staleyi DSM 6068]|uniref:exo-alpha-sialidase n=1 Tax=Pirellula staleyi (strain ATCC 27377 / DSM 6068 / ICPB 4128) TaxID=530564 RepID=D2QXS2_PIRSD|nr:Exo-alpha-sialidase [Pirellula staleyi DSM 6068]